MMLVNICMMVYAEVERWSRDLCSVEIEPIVGCGVMMRVAKCGESRQRNRCRGEDERGRGMRNSMNEEDYKV